MAVKAFAAGCAFICALGPLAALADPAPSITVQGSCSENVLPDRARIDVTAERRGPDASRAIAEATNAYNRFRADVEKLKLPDAVLDSSGVQAGRIGDDDNPKPGPVQFSATAGLSVETSSLEGLAQVMRIAAADRIDSIGPLENYLSDALHDRIVADCLPKATADARTKAQALLRGLNADLGAVQRIDGLDMGGGVMRPMAAKAAGMVRMAAAQPTADLSTARQTITVTVTVTFLIATAGK